MATRKPTKTRKSVVHKSTRAAKARAKPKSLVSKIAAKFGGVFKRRPKRIHALKDNDYRMKPYMKPKFVAEPASGGITFKQLYDSTFPPALITSRSVHLRTLKEIKTPRLKGLDGFKTYRGVTHTGDNGHNHEVVMMYLPSKDGRLAWNSPIIVSCTCAYFCFTTEVVLARRGASFIHYSNGQWPYIRNPNGRIGTCCKHIFAMSRYLIGSGIAKRTKTSHEKPKHAILRQPSTGTRGRKTAG